MGGIQEITFHDHCILIVCTYAQILWAQISYHRLSTDALSKYTPAYIWRISRASRKWNEDCPINQQETSAVSTITPPPATFCNQSCPPCFSTSVGTVLLECSPIRCRLFSTFLLKIIQTNNWLKHHLCFCETDANICFENKCLLVSHNTSKYRP